jgi:hypothetical protein
LPTRKGGLATIKVRTKGGRAKTREAAVMAITPKRLNP